MNDSWIKRASFFQAMSKISLYSYPSEYSVNFHHEQSFNMELLKKTIAIKRKARSVSMPLCAIGKRLHDCAVQTPRPAKTLSCVQYTRTHMLAIKHMSTKKSALITVVIFCVQASVK